MKKYFSLLFTILVFSFATGCVPKVQDNESNTNKNTQTQAKIYNSVADYMDETDVSDLGTGVLEISREKNELSFEMDIAISPKLDYLFQNTKNEFYFNIKDATEEEKLKKLWIKNPMPIKCDLDKMKNGKYTIREKMKLKPDISSEDAQELLKPENYYFQVLDEDKKEVSAVIGLDTGILEYVNDEPYNPESADLDKLINHLEPDLKISRDKNELSFEMNIALSSELEDVVLNIKNEFYFNIADATEEGKFKKTWLKVPIPIKGDLEKLKNGKFTIWQKIEIKPDVSAEEIRELLNPNNYVLEVLDENKHPIVAISSWVSAFELN